MSLTFKKLEKYHEATGGNDRVYRIYEVGRLYDLVMEGGSEVGGCGPCHPTLEAAIEYAIAIEEMKSRQDQYPHDPGNPKNIRNAGSSNALQTHLAHLRVIT